MNDWENFFIAEVGASAALTGLILVGVSINLNKILSVPALPSRVLAVLSMLLTVLIISSLLLVPGQSLSMVGIEVLVIGLCVWLAVIRLDIHIWRNTEANAPYRRGVCLSIFVDQFTLLFYAIGGVVILCRGVDGLYWLVPAILLSFIKAFWDARVLLVEINR
jgi:modulator of FtsH protease